MHDAATELEINPSFVRISSPEPLILLSFTIVKYQAYGYRITQTIQTGVLPTDPVLLEIGPVSHSR